MTFLGHLDRVWQAHWSPVTVTLGSLFQQQQQHPSSHPSSQQPPLSNLTIASCSGDRTVRIHSLSLSPEDSDEYSHLKNTLRKKYKKAALRCSHSSCVSVLDMDAHKRTIRSVQFAPSGRMLATASFDGTTAVWEKQTTTTTTTPHNQDDEMDDDKLGGLFDCVATLEGHENEVNNSCRILTLFFTCIKSITHSLTYSLTE